MSMNSIPAMPMAPSADNGLSNLEIYAILLAIGLVLVFAVLVVIMLNVISINKKINTSDKEKAVPTAEEKPASVRNKQTAMAYRTNCPFCGAELPDGAQFCNKCGNQIK